MYGYMYIYNIFLHWMCIYIYTGYIHVHLEPGSLFSILGYILQANPPQEQNAQNSSNQRRRHQQGHRQIHIYIYAYMLSLYLELGFHFSILELYGNIKSFILEESNFEHVDFFLFVFSPAIVGDFFNNHFES